MRAVILVTALVLGLSGCTGNFSRTASPSAEAATTPGSNTESGRGPDVSPGMSTAGQALLEQGRAQRRAGNFAQASASLERALRIEPGQPVVWLELGRLRFDEGNPAQAEQMGRKALSLAPAESPVRAEASRLVADAQYAQGR